MIHGPRLRVAGPVRAALAAATLLAAASTGEATDLWTRPPTTAATLGSCPAPGAYPLPGTDGCLRIGGSLAAEVDGALPTWHGALGRPSSAVGPSPVGDLTRTVAQARLTADVRVPTEFGPFRAFVSIRNRRGF